MGSGDLGSGGVGVEIVAIKGVGGVRVGRGSWGRRGWSWVRRGSSQGVWVEEVRGVGVDKVGVGIGGVWVKGSSWDRRGRSVGLGSGVRFRKSGLGGGGQVGGIGITEVRIRRVEVGGDLGSKKSGSRGLMTFPTFLTQLPRFQLP